MTEPTKETLEQAIALAREGKIQEGAVKLKWIATNFPESSLADDAWYYLGLLYLENKKNQAAATCFERVVRMYPESNVFRYAFLRLNMLKREIDPAHELFLQAENAYKNRELRRSLELFIQVQMEYNNSTLADNALYYQGLIHELLHEFEGDKNHLNQARVCYEKVLEDFPDSDSAQLILNLEKIKRF